MRYLIQPRFLLTLHLINNSDFFFHHSVQWFWITTSFFIVVFISNIWNYILSFFKYVVFFFTTVFIHIGNASLTFNNKINVVYILYYWLQIIYVVAYETMMCTHQTNIRTLILFTNNMNIWVFFLALNKIYHVTMLLRINAKKKCVEKKTFFLYKHPVYTFYILQSRRLIFIQ